MLPTIEYLRAVLGAAPPVMAIFPTVVILRQLGTEKEVPHLATHRFGRIVIFFDCGELRAGCNRTMPSGMCVACLYPRSPARSLALV